MKKFIYLIIAVSFFSCSKFDDIIELLNEVKAQNEALKTNVVALQRTTDSLSAALKTTNSTLVTIDKKVDSLKLQISSVLTQINALNAQMTTANANIADIQAKILELQKKCEELYSLLNSYIYNINLNSGLVAYYPFNGNALDSTTNSNNGVVGSSVSLSSDRFGKNNSAYNFSGGTIVVPHKTYLAIQPNGQFSISLWVNKTGNQNPVHVVGKRSSGAQSFNWQIGQHTTPAGLPGGGLQFSGVSGSTEIGIGYDGLNNTVIQMNKWEHIVGTYNNGKWSLYKNGNLIAQKTFTIFTADDGTPALQIGNSGGWGAFFGLIDDIRIYNRELNLSEVTNLYKLAY